MTDPLYTTPHQGLPGDIPGPGDPGEPGGPGRPGGPDDPGGPGGGFWRGIPAWWAAVVGLLVVAIIVLIVVIVAQDDDDDVQTTEPTPEVTVTVEPSPEPTVTAEPTTTQEGTPTPGATPTPQATPTSEPTATPEPSPTPTTEPTATATPTTEPTPPEDPFATAVWPWADSSVRYDDPLAATRGFAVDFVGFDDPVIGEFMQGDSRSGEVEIRPEADGPITTVFVRQLGPDDSWWVLGAVTQNIVVDQPDALSEIDDPVTVEGMSLAFEGTVVVHVRADGQADPLVETFVTGGGTEMGPFEEEISWPNPGEGSGALVFFTESARDGTILEASVLRVHFAPTS